ncbi:MAG TPA: hypothetical protein VFK19_00995 [Sphingomicrobium sp.]|nr:hypothetical protein [Sphingomicrobium sp.]
MVDLQTLWDLLNSKITKKRFDELTAKTPKRICFGSTHQKALKSAPSGPVGYFNVPFTETIGTLFPWRIFSNKYGYSRTIKTATEFDEVSAWIDANRDVVFIRSLLDSCVATCEHQTDDHRSEVGELEYRAKWRDDEEAIVRLATILVETFQRLLSNARIDAVTAIPSSTPGKKSVPCKLAEALATELGIENITERVFWAGKKDTIKDKGASEKWAILDQVGMTVDVDLKGRRVLIIDDMYQSGATVHFVASKLQEAGASTLHCLAVSKSRGDKDNV